MEDQEVKRLRGWRDRLDRQLAIYGEARGTGGAFGEGVLIDEDYLAVLDLYCAVALKLTHDPGDHFAGRGDHVRQVLVRQAHVEYRSGGTVALPETLAEVQEQGCQARRDFPVQEALYDIVGLPEALGERSKELMANSGRRFMTSVRAAFCTLATRTSVTVSAKTSCQRPSTRLNLPKTP